jgi:hypothetical protein
VRRHHGAAASVRSAAVRENRKQEGEEKEEREKKKGMKRKEGKNKKYGKKIKLENFWEKNKR